MRFVSKSLFLIFVILVTGAVIAKSNPNFTETYGWSKKQVYSGDNQVDAFDTLATFDAANCKDNSEGGSGGICVWTTARQSNDSDFASRLILDKTFFTSKTATTQWTWGESAHPQLGRFGENSFTKNDSTVPYYSWVFLPSENGVYCKQSADNSAPIQILPTGKGHSNAIVNSLAVPNYPDSNDLKLFVVERPIASCKAGSCKDQISYSTFNGTSWTSWIVPVKPAEGLKINDINGYAKPDGTGAIYLATSGGLYVCTGNNFPSCNTSAKWVKLLNDPTLSHVIAPKKFDNGDKIVFAGGANGLYVGYLSAGAWRWEHYTTSSPQAEVLPTGKYITGLAIAEDVNGEFYLYASSYGFVTENNSLKTDSLTPEEIIRDILMNKNAAVTPKVYGGVSISHFDPYYYLLDNWSKSIVYSDSSTKRQFYSPIVTSLHTYNDTSSDNSSNPKVLVTSIGRNEAGEYVTNQGGYTMLGIPPKVSGFMREGNTLYVYGHDLAGSAISIDDVPINALNVSVASDTLVNVMTNLFGYHKFVASTKFGTLLLDAVKIP